MQDLTRRDFLETGRAAGAGALGNAAPAAALAQAAGVPFAAPPIELVRIGTVGVGLQGGDHLKNFLKIPG